MTRVLIVEDDKLVRKSLISSFEWNKFGMEIVGDAKNGEKALQFIEEQPVDLIITDLAMPIMSGIELIRIVKERYPKIFIVVLSLHRDFEYIQEAMRLGGAIDYIAKIELDENNMDQILHRIQQRIEKEYIKQQQPNIQDIDAIDFGFGFVSPPKVATCKLVLNELMEDENIVALHNACIIVNTPNYSVEELVTLLIESEQTIRPLLCVKPSNHKEFSEMKLLINKYYEQLLFYELHHDMQIAIKTLEQLPTTTDFLKQRINWKEKLPSLDWIANQDDFNEMMRTLKEARLPQEQLEAHLTWAINDCKKVYGDILPENIDVPDNLNYWSDVESWLTEVKRKIYMTVYSSSYSAETNQCIIQAISIIKKKLSVPPSYRPRCCISG